MWIFVGRSKTLDRVVGGKRVERPCDACGQTAAFHEKKITQTIHVYFVKLFAYAPKHVMVCSACDATFATDDLEAPTFRESQRGTVLGAVGSLADKARTAIDSARVEQAEERIGDALEEAKGVVRGWLKRRSR